MLTAEVVDTGRKAGEVRPSRNKTGWNHDAGNHKAGRDGVHAARAAVIARRRLPVRPEFAYYAVNHGRMGRSNGKCRLSDRSHTVIRAWLGRFRIRHCNGARFGPGRDRPFAANWCPSLPHRIADADEAVRNDGQTRNGVRVPMPGSVWYWGGSANRSGSDSWRCRSDRRRRWRSSANNTLVNYARILA